MEDGETLDTVAPEDALMRRAADLPSSQIMVWLTPFDDVMVAPDRLPAMIAEIQAANPPEPTLVDQRAAERLVDFLWRAHSSGCYVRLVDSN